MRAMSIRWVLAVAVATVIFRVAEVRAAESTLTESQLVELAVAANPQVRAARARWDSAVHSISQTVAPNDPVFTYTNGDSPKNPFGRASLRSYNVTETFQFPGKAMHQRDIAARRAEIAHLALAATIRDIRAATETGYFQLLLDSALGAVNAENLTNLERVLKVTQVAYSANKVTQTDFIGAEFDLAATRQLQHQYQIAVANDETALNQLLYRPPGSPLPLDRTLRLESLNVRLDALIDQASAIRQEILQAALAERNTDTAIYLARMEFLPDFTVGYTFDNYLVPSFGPRVSQTQDHSLIVGFNVPVFFWLKQNEDVVRAKSDLEAARFDLASIKSQTAAAVTTLFRNAQLGYETAILYRDSLTPLARQDFEVALTSYQSGKIDFVTLAAAQRRSYDARVNYLQGANQFLAGEVALEQAIGAPLHQ